MHFRQGHIFSIVLLFLASWGSPSYGQFAPPQRAAPPPRAQAPAPANPYLAANRWAMGLVTSGADGTSLQMAADLARVLNDGPNLRLIPMVGESSIQNVTDLLFLRGADLAVVQSDVLSQLKRTKRLPGIEERLQYIAKLHSEEFHVLARMKFLCLADLTGRKVNFGVAGSGSALTAEAVFESNRVKVQPQYLDQAAALEKLKSGEIDAAVLVTGKPSAAFDKIKHTDKVHFLDVDFMDSLQKDYLPAVMTHDDYPDLIAQNETVGTVAVSTVLAVVSAKAGTEQHRKISRFVESFFTNMDKLRQPPRHVKWQEVNPALPLTGWARFPPAQSWLASNPQAQPTFTVLTQPSADPAPVSTGAIAAPKPAESRQLQGPQSPNVYARSRNASAEGSREELFNEFVRWYQQANPQ